MSHQTARRKPAVEDYDDTFDFVQSCVDKSVVSSKFREENPNLQPTTSSSSNELAYSSLDPSTVTPPSPPASQLSKGRYATTAAAPPPQEETMARQSSTVRDKLKRFSWGPQGAMSAKRLSSVSSSLNRLTLKNSRSTPAAATGSKSHDAPYWKYHILQFGKDLYLTTNPSLKHMYCRNGSGYYVEINGPPENPTDLTNGFTMVFKDVENVGAGSVQASSQAPPIMVIEKHSRKQGGYLTVTLIRKGHLEKDVMSYDPTDHTVVKPFNALAIPQTIPEEYIPYDKVSNLRRLESSETSFKNYEFKDFNNSRWNIGSLPRVRYSKLNNFKHKLNDHDEQQLKFIGRKNIYFHQNYIGTQNTTALQYKKPSQSARDIYLQTSEHDFPPVLAVFRPMERTLSRKLVNSLSKRMSGFGNDKSARSDPAEAHTLSRSSSSWSLSRVSSQVSTRDLEYDFSDGQIKHYYKAGDGLYYSRHPADDSPDSNKVGWLTIFEDQNLFAHSGMFDLVLGLTLAVGFESTLGK